MIKNKKMISLAIVLLIAASLIIGCGTKDKAEENRDMEATIQVIDQQGRTVEIPKQVERVVTSYMPATNMVYAVGAQHKLVGVNDKTHSNKFLTAVYPDIINSKEIGSKGEGLNMEAVVALKPDVVILFSGKESQSIAQQLETQKIPAVIINPESIDEILECIELIGTVVGEEEQAQQLVKYYKDTLEKVDNKVEEIPLEDRRSVYLAGSNGLLSTNSSDMYQHHLIERAGGVNVAAGLTGGWNQVSAEQLIDFNPDFITVVQYSREDVATEITANPQYSNIEAIKNNEVYLFPSNMGPWDFPEPRSILGILWLADKLYPSQFADVDVLAEIEEFHLQFYGKSFTELGGHLNDDQIKERLGQ